MNSTSGKSKPDPTKSGRMKHMQSGAYFGNIVEDSQDDSMDEQSQRTLHRFACRTLREKNIQLFF